MKNLGSIKETLVEWYRSFKVFTKKLDETDNPRGSFGGIDYSEEEVAKFNSIQHEYVGSISGLDDFEKLSHAQILIRCLEIQNLIHFNLVGNMDKVSVKELENDYAFIHNLMLKVINYFTAK